MWGGLKVAAAVLLVVFGVVFTGIYRNSDAVQQTRKVVAKNERQVNRDIKGITHALTVISMNQKRQMESSGLPYYEPEPTHYFEGE